MKWVKLVQRSMLDKPTFIDCWVRIDMISMICHTERDDKPMSEAHITGAGWWTFTETPEEILERISLIEQGHITA